MVRSTPHRPSTSVARMRKSTTKKAEAGLLHSRRLGPRAGVQLPSLSGHPGLRQGLKLLVKGDKDFGYDLRVLQAGSLQLHPERSDLGPVKAHAQGAWFAPDRPLLHHLTLLCPLHG